ncbi:winged helix-turn-helix domain-containing protein [Pseudoalteromonas sp. MMG013]|uniref:winged helix-turn-helix domain-containing protein n=1 Tax=Pseudoalteromonas sp. MMG013 TaxID=2822687 RepID=UPI001B395B24|nr:winged helix-turn-helix domain-containing protein [Pseudoalteromonas sp. MMG013]MBQ4861843.1 winged helix-turn-helix domain-containing protein [Pseudoalteromonas sp. MMG013]
MGLQAIKPCERLYINECLIDPNTGEVMVNGHSYILEPKVMALLLILAERPHYVFSAEYLFERVWPRSVYSPNSVRRNIALLRQALSDNDKSVIKTHPKRGYSLAADVKKEQPVQKQVKNKQAGANVAILTAAGLCCVCLCVWLYDSVMSKPTIQLSNLSPVTASDESERYMQVGAEGRFMAYIQNGQSSAQRRLLMKDLITKQSWQLSEEMHEYTYLAWDTNNHAVVYSYNSPQGVTFGRVLLNSQTKPVSNEVLFARRDIRWNSLFHIDNKQNLYYLANFNASEHSRNVSLYQHNLISGKIIELLAPRDDFKPYKLALSPDHQRLALIGFDEQSISEVQLYKIKTHQISELTKIDHNWHFMTWLADQDVLLLSNGSQVKLLTLTGKVSDLNFKSYNFLIYPQGVRNKLYFIEGQSDQDILTSQLDVLVTPKKIIDSNTVDKGAAFSPSEQYMAYVSMKSGVPQLFVQDIASSRERLVFENSDKALSLASPVWDHDSKRFASAVNNMPFIVHLQESTFTIEFIPDVIGLPKAWVRLSNALLFIDKKTHSDRIVKVDLDTQQNTVVTGSVLPSNVFLDNQDRILSAAGGRITVLGSDHTLLTAPSAITQIYPTPAGFYYRYDYNMKPEIGFYSFERGEIELSDKFRAFCHDYCEQITSFSNNYILLSKNAWVSDILSLDITTNI